MGQGKTGRKRTVEEGTPVKGDADANEGEEGLDAEALGGHEAVEGGVAAGLVVDCDEGEEAGEEEEEDDAPGVGQHEEGEVVFFFVFFSKGSAFVAGHFHVET